GDVAALHAHGVRREGKPDCRDARERRAGRAVRGQPVGRVRQIPEVMEGALLEGIEKRRGAGGVGWGRAGWVVGGAGGGKGGKGDKGGKGGKAGRRHRRPPGVESATKPMLSSAAPISGLAMN